MANSSNETAKQSSAVARETSSHSAYSFRFVDVGTPSQTCDEEAQALIRSHFMRDFYDRRDNRKQPCTHPEKTSAASKKGGAAQQTHRFKVGPQGLEEIKKKRRKRGSVAEAQITAITLTTPTRPAGKAREQTHDVVPDFNLLQPAETTSRQSDSLASSSVNREQDNSETNILQRSLNHLLRSDTRTDLQPESFLMWSAIDPFNTLPPSRSPRTQLLLYHATRGILSSRLMGQLRTEWLSLAIQDTAMFHIALSHYAGNYGLANQENDPVEALRFRMEAMRLVNQRLSDIGNALGDGTLGTVASLSSYEATNGTLTAIDTHMKGLQRLVALRGGLEADINPFTRRLILWADLNCANALGNMPVFDLVNGEGSREVKTPNVEVIQRGRHITSSNFPQTEPFGVKDSGAVGLELRDNFTRLKQLAIMDADTGPRGNEEKIRHSDKLYMTERNLLILANTCGPGKFATAGCLAAIIFLDNHLRGIGFNARLMDRFAIRLKVSMNMVLNQSSSHKPNEKTTKAILWVLYVGGLAADDRPERQWFTMQLLDFCDTLGLKTWEETELVLKDFLWAPSWHYQGQSLWIQVEEIRFLKNIEWSMADDDIDTDMR
ncbi:hypothetical protein ONS95_009328 [Cadophora gregata]|uniref:uncharacterized protein n=1 Tax=Cadophora gregata TaxID=51156 RepID=UPI0026DD322C|nr:uncharacterized protein ONS95_009328 [Cadophora gregata]KAK0124360.1 hypothetical protein ONS95_009328 [Cadophora gregata]